MIVQNEKGYSLFQECKRLCEYIEISMDDCIQPNLLHPTPKPFNRKRFWQLYNKYGIEYIIKKFGHTRISTKIISKIKRSMIRITGNWR